MTKVYFVRHAEAEKSVRDGYVRPLTAKGMVDRKLATQFLKDKKIDVVFASSFKRAIDTVLDFADTYGFKVNIVDEFKERKSDITWIDGDDFWAFMEKQWHDFSYTLDEGESLLAVQKRNIKALNEVLKQNEGKNIVIGTHGTALSTIINYYDSTYGYKDFMAMVHLMPWIVEMTFNGLECVDIKKINLFA